MYGLAREEAEHVLDSFFVVRKYDERDHGEYRTKRLVLEAYDRMAAAIANGGKGRPTQPRQVLGPDAAGNTGGVGHRSASAQSREVLPTFVDSPVVPTSGSASSSRPARWRSPSFDG